MHCDVKPLGACATDQDLWLSPCDTRSFAMASAGVALEMGTCPMVHIDSPLYLELVNG